MPARQPTPAHNLKTTRKGKVKRRSVFWRWRRALFLVGLAAVVGFAGVAWVLSRVKLPPSEPPQLQTSFICTAEVQQDCSDGNAIATLHGAVNRIEVTNLDEVPEVIQHAVLAAEDRNFFKHGGVDPVGIGRAALADLTSGAKSQGGSTITQQYVRNVYLNQQRTWTRKIKEAVLAVKIEQKLSKKEIFRRYLNIVYFGRGAYGIRAAAQAYFGVVDLKAVSPAQAAFLAGIIRSPGTDPTIPTQTKYATDLRKIVLDGMVKQKWLSRTDASAALSQPITIGMTGYTPTNGMTWRGGVFGSDPTNAAGSQYFVDYVRRQVIKLVGEQQAYGGGLRVYTTLDPSLQQKAYDSLAHVLSNLPFGPKPQAAMVSIDNKGRVVAMVSGDRAFGTGPDQSQVNLATGQAGGGGGRQSGSSFKPFALATAVDEGYSINSGFPAPAVLTIPDGNGPGKPWKVNSEAFPGGYANLVDATTYSLNAVYAQLMVKLGPDKVIDMAKRLGVDDDGTAQLPAVPAAVLGTVAVSPYDMASAYSTFSDDGQHTVPTSIAKITNGDGKVIWQADQKQTQVLTQDDNAKVVYGMSSVLTQGTAAGKALPWPAAGKTGTTENNGDGWFVGFTPNQLTTAVWMGYPEGQSRTLPSWVYGGTYPAQIWHDYMYAALSEATAHPALPYSSSVLGGSYLGAPAISTSSSSSSSSSSSTTVPGGSSSSSSTSTTKPHGTSSTSSTSTTTHPTVPVAGPP